MTAKRLLRVALWMGISAVFCLHREALAMGLPCLLHVPTTKRCYWHLLVAHACSTRADLADLHVPRKKQMTLSHKNTSWSFFSRYLLNQSKCKLLARVY